MPNSDSIDLTPSLDAAAAADPLVAQLTHLPFPEVADAIRFAADRITLSWDTAVRHAIPQMRLLSVDDLKDSTPQILRAIADALASDDPALIRELVRCAPFQGLSRFRLQLDVTDVMQEDRLLRAITVQAVEARLSRQLSVAESAALHAAIDVMLQRSVVALVDQQKARLRAAAQTEIKYLSFLSHDLNNHLGGVAMTLDCLQRDLKASGRFADLESSVTDARRAIDDTVGGMRQMLNHERLRAAGGGGDGAAQALVPVDLFEAATAVARQCARHAAMRRLTLVVEVQPGARVTSDRELLLIVLQNLVGNGVKWGRTAVRIGSDLDPTDARQTVWVSDDGPGIAPEQLGPIFEAFRRGEVHGQEGVGLGLAIASQAARLLGAELTVQSRPGSGSTFRLHFPLNAAGATLA